MLYSADASRDQLDAIVLSERLWRRLGGQTQVPIGHQLSLDGQPFQVVGVLPASTGYPREADAWIPLPYSPDWLNDYGSLTLLTVARLQAGVGQSQVTEMLAAEVARWRATSGLPYALELHLSSFAEFDSGALRPAVISLFVAVVLLLIIASLNVANLQMVRLSSRTSEFGIRSALGGGRSAVLRQLILESSLLGCIGGAIGIGMAYGLITALQTTLGNQFPVLRQLALDAPTLGIGLAAMLGSTLLFGIIPVLRISRSDAAMALSRGRAAGSGRDQSRFLRIACIGQVAVALALLALAGATYQTLQRLLDIDPGFRVANLTTFDVTLPRTSYATPESRRLFAANLLSQLSSAAEVDAVGFATPLPLTPAAHGMNSPFSIPGLELASGTPERHASTVFVGGEYFRLMGIPLLRGRLFAAHETGAPTAVIIDETLAATWFPDTDPIGAAIRQGAELTIVGVVGAVRSRGLSGGPTPTIYRNYDVEPWTATLSLIVGGRSRTAVSSGTVARALRAVDPGVAPYHIRPVRDLLDAATSIGRLSMLMLALFAVAAVALAVAGVYGVASSSVAQRRHELSVRLAIGATPAAIIRLVVRQGAQIAGLGVLVGAGLYTALVMSGRNILYGVATVDLAVIVLASIPLIVAATTAAFIPAYRASRTPPALALTSQ